MTTRRDFLATSAVATASVVFSHQVLASEKSVSDSNSSSQKPKLSPATSSLKSKAGIAPSVTLNNGVEMPILGLGTFNSKEKTAHSVRFALENGYRLIDTAKNYENEDKVGDGIRQSGIKREDLFLTTKLWIEDFGKDKTKKAFEMSLKKLGLDYVDLYLLHWPNPKSFKETIEAYTVCEELLKEKRIRALGVSNFQASDLELLLKETSVVPAVNQVEFQPYFTQREIEAVDSKNGTKTEAWSPIAGNYQYSDKYRPEIFLLKDKLLNEIANRYSKTPAQVVLRWHTQENRIVVPKSVHESRILENISIFDFRLKDEDMTLIGSLDKGLRGGPNPDLFDVSAFKELQKKREQTK